MSAVDGLNRRQEDALDRLRAEVNLGLRKYYRRLMAEGKAHIMAQSEIEDANVLGLEAFEVAEVELRIAFGAKALRKANRGLAS